MHDSHPGIELRATVKDYPDAIANLRAGELDAVLGWSGPFDDDLAWQVVRSFPFCAAMREDHPEAGRSRVDRQRLGSYPVALFARANGPEAYDFITDAIRPQDADVEVIVVPNIADSIGAMLHRVRCDSQTVTITFAAAMAERPTDGLRLVALDPPLAVELMMIWMPRHDPPALQFVRSLLTRQM